MGAAAYGRKDPIGAASCLQQHNQMSCQAPFPILWE